MTDIKNNVENIKEEAGNIGDKLEVVGSEEGAKAFGKVKEALETALIVDEYINVYEKHGIEAATIYLSKEVTKKLDSSAIEDGLKDSAELEAMKVVVAAAKRTTWAQEIVASALEFVNKDELANIVRTEWSTTKNGVVDLLTSNEEIISTRLYMAGQEFGLNVAGSVIDGVATVGEIALPVAVAGGFLYTEEKLNEELIKLDSEMSIDELKQQVSLYEKQILETFDPTLRDGLTILMEDAEIALENKLVYEAVQPKVEQQLKRLEALVDIVSATEGDTSGILFGKFLDSMESQPTEASKQAMLNSLKDSDLVEGVMNMADGSNALANNADYIQELVNKALNSTGGKAIDPLILDLDGDGIETISADGSVMFDHNADGVKRGTGWVGVAGINLDGQSTTTATDGGVISKTGTFTRTDGTTADIGNLDFNQNAIYREFTDKLDTSSFDGMLNMKGIGAVRDLQEAATLSSALAEILEQINENRGVA